MTKESDQRSKKPDKSEHDLGQSGFNFDPVARIEEQIKSGEIPEHSVLKLIPEEYRQIWLEYLQLTQEMELKAAEQAGDLPGLTIKHSSTNPGEVRVGCGHNFYRQPAYSEVTRQFVHGPRVKAVFDGAGTYSSMEPCIVGQSPDEIRRLVPESLKNLRIGSHLQQLPYLLDAVRSQGVDGLDPDELDQLTIATDLNALALVERNILGREHMLECIRQRNQEGRSTHLCILACGSARAAIEAARQLQSEGITNFGFTCIDSDPEALAYLLEIAEKYGVEEHFFCKEEDIRNFVRGGGEGRLAEIAKENTTMQGEPIHYIEGLGIFDYLPGKMAVKLLRVMIENISDGQVIFANIRPNELALFLHRVMQWPDMSYRYGTAFEQLVRDVASYYPGIQSSTTTLPTGMYTVGTLKKTPGTSN